MSETDRSLPPAEEYIPGLGWFRRRYVGTDNSAREKAIDLLVRRIKPEQGTDPRPPLADAAPAGTRP